MKRATVAVIASLVTLLAAPARADTELVIAAYPPLDESVKLAIPRFERLHPGVKVKLKSLPFGDHHNAMIRALASGVDVPDVMGLDVDFIGRFAESKDALEDLGAPAYGGKPLLEKLLGFTRPQASSGTGILAAMPADVGPGTLFYRKDLLDAAGVTEEELTRSWESYIEAGKKIKAKTGAYLLAHANDIMEAYVRADTRDGENVYVHQVAGGPRYLHSSVSSPRFRRAFELAKAARAARLDARVGSWSNEWAQGLRNGSVATQMGGAWLLEPLKTWIAPEASGLWRAAQLPGGAFVTYGGSFYAIPRKAAHKAGAWKFVKFMCFDRRQQIDVFRALGAWPALLDAQNDGVVDEPLQYLGGQRARRIWKVAAVRAPAIAVRKYDPVARDVVNAEIEQVLEKDKDISRALADVEGQRRTVKGFRW